MEALLLSCFFCHHLTDFFMVHSVNGCRKHISYPPSPSLSLIEWGIFPFIRLVGSPYAFLSLNEWILLGFVWFMAAEDKTHPSVPCSSTDRMERIFIHSVNDSRRSVPFCHWMNVFFKDSLDPCQWEIEFFHILLCHYLYGPFQAMYNEWHSLCLSSFSVIYRRNSFKIL